MTSVCRNVFQNLSDRITRNRNLVGTRLSETWLRGVLCLITYRIKALIISVCQTVLSQDTISWTYFIDKKSMRDYFWCPVPITLCVIRETGHSSIILVLKRLYTCLLSFILSADPNMTYSNYLLCHICVRYWWCVGILINRCPSLINWLKCLLNCLGELLVLVQAHMRLGVHGDFMWY